jgi:NADPH-dependent glutamate synthase beta subunit-like oxidoreductase
LSSVARDLAPLGYRCVVLDRDPKAGGMMRTRIPRFRVPEPVIDEEVGYILDLGVEFRGGADVTSLKALLAEGWDAVFVGAGAPRGLDLDLPGRAAGGAHVHIGVEWLANIWFGHVGRIGERVVVIGGGNTAMDCARSARRLGGREVQVVVRSPFAEMKAAPWEREDVRREGIAIHDNLVPKEFIVDDGRVTAVMFQPVRAVYEGGRRRLIPTGASLEPFPCDDVIIAVGQQPAFPWIERDLGIAFGERGLPKIDPVTFQSTHAKVLFGGDAAFGPKNIITAVAHGHEAAISIDRFLSGADVAQRPAPSFTLAPKRMPLVTRRIPEVSPDARLAVPLRPQAAALANIRAEVELGFDLDQAVAEAGRCLDCDLQTVFSAPLCVECKACESVCPTDCITFTRDCDEECLRQRLKAPALNRSQDIYMADGLVSGRVMVKSEDLCLHCGLCAQNCPTGAWQMQSFLLKMAHAAEARVSADAQGAGRG